MVWIRRCEVIRMQRTLGRSCCHLLAPWEHPRLPIPSSPGAASTQPAILARILAARLAFSSLNRPSVPSRLR